MREEGALSQGRSANKRGAGLPVSTGLTRSRSEMDAWPNLLTYGSCAIVVSAAHAATTEQPGRNGSVD